MSPPTRATLDVRLPKSFPASTALESTLGALPVPAYANDLKGFLVWQNDASRAAVGELRGAHYTHLVAPEELHRAREAWAAVTVGGETRRRAGVFKAADGRLVRLEAIVAPLRNDGRIVGVFGIALPLDDDPPRSLPSAQLTPRQIDVLRLLARGKSTQQIAEELHLAPATVRNHVARLLKALGARTRLEAALIALRYGLVSLDLD
jgi:DNA-binding CsgD family transcriptional regulator